MGAVGESLIISVIIRAIDGASSVFSMLGLNGIRSMGLLTAAAATTAAAIGAVGISSIVSASSFDMAMHKVAGLTDLISSSGKSMQYWEDQLLALAPQIDVSPTKLAQALYFVASAGIPANQVLSVLRYSAMAATATMGDMGKVADLVTSAMNAYKNQGMDAATATNIIVDAVKNGKVEMHALETSFAFVATTGLAAKFSLQEVAAAVSTLTQVSGNSAARRVQMDLDNLIRRLGDVGGVANTAKKLGLAFDETKFASSGLIDRLTMLMQMSGFTTNTLDQMRAAAHGNEQVFEQMALKAAQNSTTFKSLAGGAAAMIPAVILMNDKGATFNRILGEMNDKSDKVTAAFNTMRQSTGQQWNMFRTTLQSISIELGLHLLPYVNMLLQGLIHAGRGFIAFIQSKKGMEELKTTLIGIAWIVGGLLVDAIVGAVVAAAPFLLAIASIVVAGRLLGPVIERVWQHFGGLHGILQRLHPLFVTIGAALHAAGQELHKAFANPAVQHALAELQKALPQLLPFLKLLAVVVGVTLVVAFNFVVAALRGILAALPGVIGFFRGLFEIIGNVARLVIDIFTGKWNDIIPALKAIGKGILDALKGALSAAGEAAVGFIDHFLGLFGGSVGKLKKAVGDWIAGAGKAISDCFDGIKKWIQGRLDDIGTGIANFAGGLKDLVADGLNALKNAFEAPFKAIGGFFDWLYNHNYRFKAAVDELKRTVTQLRDHIEQIINHIRTWLTDRWNDIKRDVQDAWTWIHDHIIQPVQDAIKQVQDAVNGVKTWLLGRWNDIKTDIGNAWSNLMSKAGDILTQIKNWVSDNVVKPISDAIGQMIKDAEDWGKNLIKSFGKGIQDMGGWLKDTAGNVIGGVTHWMGFHSPSKGLPESAQWGPNLVRMFAAGMLSQASLVSLAAQQVVLGAANVMAGAGAPGGAGAMAGAGVGAGAAILASGTGGGVTNITHQHNWDGAFPNATNQQEIVKAIRQVQQEDYRRGRRAGGYGGLRAGVAPI